MFGFVFDSQNRLEFDAWFVASNEIEVSITTVVNPTVTPLVQISSVVLGAPICTDYLGMYP